MDTGMLKNNTMYYDGYEGEKEIILYFKNNPTYNLHIWDGYFDDIFSDPVFHKNGWNGFTRDYQEDINTFSDDGNPHEINSLEYLNDAKEYLGKKHRYKETDSCLDLIISFLELSISSNETVMVSDC